jgi:hypothetical protein
MDPIEEEQAEATIKYPDVDMDTILQEWEASKQNTDNYTVDFPQLANIVDGVPLTHEKGTPYMGDTTVPGFVRSIPRESIQQLPIFGAVVNGSKNTVHAAVCSWLLRKGVFNENTFGKGLLSTCQMGAEQALTYGYAAFMCATGTMYKDYGTTMRLLHYADVAPEPGISDHNEAGYDYVIANLTRSRVQDIRDSAAENPNTPWDVGGLDELLEMKPEGRNYSLYLSDVRKNPQGNSPTYTMVTRYKNGKKGKFVTFCPQLGTRALRVVPNKSKFGFPRISFLVIDPAPLTPFGISRVRLASPHHNFNNAYYQNVGSMLLYNSDPAVLQRGKFSTPVQRKRKAVWRTTDPQASVEFVEMGNSTLQQFPTVMEHTSKQIQTIMGRPSARGDYGNTSPGAKQQIKFDDSSTNQVTNIIENFLRQYALVALDTMISEQLIDQPEGGEKIPNTEELIIDDEAKNTINRIAQEAFEASPEQPAFTPPVGDDNKFTIDWNDFYDYIEDLAVEIELSIGKDELEEKTRADLQDMLTVMTQNADPNDVQTQNKIKEIQDRLLQKTIPDSKRMDTTPKPVGNPNFDPASSGQTTTEVSDQVSMTQ